VSSPLLENSPKTKIPLGLVGASGLKSALFSELLCTPQQARRIAVMMMVAMRRSCTCAAHRGSFKIKETGLGVNEMYFAVENRLI
jgi:hypothetical protein